MAMDNLLNDEGKGDDEELRHSRHTSDGSFDSESEYARRDDNARKTNVFPLGRRLDKRKFESVDDKNDVVIKMSDVPSRSEIAAQLQAAEARTETRIAQLSAAMEARAMASDHKIDFLAGKIDALAGAVSEMKTDTRETRRAIWIVGIGAVLTVFGLMVALWVAGLNVENNMISVFQAGLGTRATNQAPTASINPPAASPQPSIAPNSQKP